MTDALGALDRGDPAPLVAALQPLLHGATLDEENATRAWYAVCTLYGVVPPPPHIRQGDQRWPMSLDHPPFRVTGGPPRVLDDPPAFAAGLLPLLARPPSREAHRLALLDALARPPGDDLARLDALCTLLDHHAGRPTSVLTGRRPLVQAVVDPFAPYRALPLADPAAFQRHLEAGLTSPAAGRRSLSGRLLGIG